MSQPATVVSNGVHAHPHPDLRGLTTDVGSAGSGRRRHRTRLSCVAVAVTVAVLALGGCGSSGTTNTSTTSTSSSAAKSSSAQPGPSTSASYPAGKEQVCQARDELQQSITALINPSLLLGGTTAIKAAVDQVHTDLDAVTAAGKQDYQPQITALQSSLQQLDTAVGNLGNGNTAANLTAVGTAIGATGNASAALLTQLKTACGS